MELITVLQILLILISLGFIWYNLPRYLKGVYCPPSAPLLGHVPTVLKHFEQIWQFMLDSTRKCGENTWHLAMPFHKRFIHLASVEDMQHMHKERFNDYIKGHDFQEAFLEILGRHSIFSTLIYIKTHSLNPT